MSAWLPSDDELDTLARDTARPEPGPARVEHVRTSVLAGAAAVRQRSRRPAWPLVAAAIAVPLAAAAVLIVWLRTPSPNQLDERVRIEPVAATYANVADWPDRTVQLDDGALTITVGTLAADEQFHVRTPDAELLTAGARFVVAVRTAHVDAVSVATGRVELRVTGERPVFLAAGQSWTRAIVAQRDELPIATSNEPMHVADATRVVREPEVPAKVVAPPAAPPVEHTAPKPAEKPEAPAPGEGDFRAGMAALRGGDAATAATSFASACATATAALAEDACFWVGAAARRAGQTATARDALVRFLARFPGSARAGEAAALLGWIAFEAGELDAAKRLFERAVGDRVPRVRESATRGLTAIERKRH